MTEEEKYTAILNQCSKEIHEVLDKYNVTIETDQYYDSSWIKLAIDGEEKYTNKHGIEMIKEYDLIF